MATYNVYFPGGIYPAEYSPPLEGYTDWIPFIEEFLTSGEPYPEVVGTPSATQMRFELSNGLFVNITGTGLTYDDSGYPVGGTVTGLYLYLSDNSSLLQSITGLNIPAETFQDASEAFDEFDFARFLMRGSDTLIGSAATSDLLGYGGNDIFLGGSGDEYMVGGEGTDTYNGGGGFDTISFQDAYRNPNAYRGVTIDATGGVAIDSYGNSETFQNIESFRGSQFGDIMGGSDADEAFMGLGGRDTINGKGGVDTIRFDRDANFDGTNSVAVNLTTGIAMDGFGRQDTILNIENVRATNFNDSIVGNTVSNFIRTYAGNDTLDGRGGADHLAGGAGNDIYVVDNADDFVDEIRDGGSGNDKIISYVSFDLSSAQVDGDVETLQFAGSASVNGTGNGLNNILAGNAGANVLLGLDGNDVLAGGLGNDTLTGGAGNDVFLFNTTLNSATNVDTITDFSVTDDTIRLENAVYATLVGTGTLSANQFVSNTTGLAGDADDRIIYESDTGNLFYDVNGTAAGGSFQIATLSANLALTNADFFIV